MRVISEQGRNGQHTETETYLSRVIPTTDQSNKNSPNVSSGINVALVESKCSDDSVDLIDEHDQHIGNFWVCLVGNPFALAVG